VRARTGQLQFAHLHKLAEGFDKSNRTTPSTTPHLHLPSPPHGHHPVYGLRLDRELREFLRTPHRHRDRGLLPRSYSHVGHSQCESRCRQYPRRVFGPGLRPPGSDPQGKDRQSSPVSPLQGHIASGGNHRCAEGDFTWIDEVDAHAVLPSLWRLCIRLSSNLRLWTVGFRFLDRFELSSAVWLQQHDGSRGIVMLGCY
jgi:hypothetical protein